MISYVQRLAAQDGRHWTLSISISTYKHRLPSLASYRKSDSVRPHEQNTQVNDKSNIQGVAPGVEEGCGSTTTLAMTIAAAIIGEHPLNHNIKDAYCPSGGQHCHSGALCVGK